MKRRTIILSYDGGGKSIPFSKEYLFLILLSNINSHHLFVQLQFITSLSRSVQTTSMMLSFMMQVLKSREKAIGCNAI